MFTNTLPSVPKVIVEEYDGLVSELDLAIAALHQRLQNFICCTPGCSSCCRIFTVLPLEAALIAGSASVPQQTPRRGEQCSKLIDNRCSIYPQRPLICRTQGLPIGYIDEDRELIEVSACPLNFSEDHPFDHQDLLLLDSFNSRLATLNSAYCQVTGIAAEIRLCLG